MSQSTDKELNKLLNIVNVKKRQCEQILESNKKYKSCTIDKTMSNLSDNFYHVNKLVYDHTIKIETETKKKIEYFTQQEQTIKDNILHYNKQKELNKLINGLNDEDDDNQTIPTSNKDKDNPEKERRGENDDDEVIIVSDKNERKGENNDDDQNKDKDNCENEKKGENDDVQDNDKNNQENERRGENDDDEVIIVSGENEKKGENDDFKQDEYDDFIENDYDEEQDNDDDEQYDDDDNQTIPTSNKDKDNRKNERRDENDDDEDLQREKLFRIIRQQKNKVGRPPKKKVGRPSKVNIVIEKKSSSSQLNIAQIKSYWVQLSKEVYVKPNIAQKLIEYANITEEITFCDIGTGIGHIAIMVKYYSKCKKSFGIELNQRKYNQSLENKKAVNVDVDFYLGDYKNYFDEIKKTNVIFLNIDSELIVSNNGEYWTDNRMTSDISKEEETLTLFKNSKSIKIIFSFEKLSSLDDSFILKEELINNNHIVNYNPGSKSLHIYKRK